MRPREEKERPRDTTVSPPPAGQPGSGLARDEAAGGPTRDPAPSGNGHRRRGGGKGKGKGGGGGDDDDD